MIDYTPFIAFEHKVHKPKIKNNFKGK